MAPKELSPEKKRRILEKLAQRVGLENFSDREIDRIAYSRDYWPITLRWLLEKKTPPLPDFVVWPEDAEEVSEIVKIANDEEVPIVPFGEGSGVLGGAIPVNGGIVVDLKRLNKITIDDENLTVTAQTGINIMDLERELNIKGYTMGHYPQSMYCSALGGNLSTKAAGHFSTKYGKVDDMVISLKAVLPTGEIIQSKNVPKSSTGPSVDRLLLGAEGVLGIITEATLKIWPYPEERALSSFAFENLGDGLESVRKILRKGIYPAVARLYDEDETIRHFYQTPEAKGKCMLILVMEGDRDLVNLERKISESVCNEKGMDCGEGPVNHWFDTRFNVKETSDYAPRDIIFDTIEVSVTWGKSLNLYSSMIAAMKKVDGVLLSTGHASHFYPQGVCFYFTFGGAPIKKTPEEFYKEVWSAAMRACLDEGGSISHHHGIGIMRADWLEEELGGGFEALKKIKKSLDPKGIMNPGKMGL